MTEAPDVFAREAALNLTRPKKAAVVGCGGVGSWVAYLLAMAGVEELWLFDMDTVSPHNRNRVPVMASHDGKLKTEAMRDMITMVRPDCRVYAMRGFTPEIVEQLAGNMFSAGGLHWVIATTDTHASRQMVAKWASDYGVAYIEAAAEGEGGSITGQPAEWATPEEAQPGYASVPVWVGSSVAAALMACYYVLHNIHPADNSLRLEWQQRGNWSGERLSFIHHGRDAPENDDPAPEPPPPPEHDEEWEARVCANCGYTYGDHYEGQYEGPYCYPEDDNGNRRPGTWHPAPFAGIRNQPAYRAEATAGGDFNIVENNAPQGESEEDDDGN
jgi:hypothetical protein